jgi:Domain of unknown function (DUF4440)
MTQQQLAALEEGGWQALSSRGGAAGFYRRVLDDTAVMLLPGGLLLDDREAIITCMSAPPWSSYQLHGLRVFQLTPDTGIVVYEVAARRDGARPYSALVSSLYVRRSDGWKLAMHQQTPNQLTDPNNQADGCSTRG